MRFLGKVVVVTGAGSGIGEATAKRFSQEGANVVLVGRDCNKLNNISNQLPPDKTLVIQADVADKGSVEKMIEQAVNHFRKIDVFINNAGIYIAGDLLSCSFEDGQKILETNINGVIYCSHFALPYLLKSKGCIVNNASVSGLGGEWNGAYYCISKGAVVNMTRAMALDYGSQGIRINSVCPSLISTPMTNHIPDHILEQFNARTSMRRPGMPSEVAAAIAFLASDDASFINGVNLPVDGGVTASNGQPNLGYSDNIPTHGKEIPDF
jgi:meso-butanediol dehydrogenase/(S,S)-butanediol dehydrogenase/diacetyl reductase